MQTSGAYISAIGHAVLIGWLILGWGFSSEPLPFEISEVSVVTGEEYAEMVRASAPKPGDEEPTTPIVPDVDEVPPPTPTVDEQPTPAPTPDPVEEPVQDTPPPQPPEPLVPDVTDLPPLEPVQPNEVVAAVPDMEISPDPAPRDLDRISPDPVVSPPDTTEADVPVEVTQPAEQPEPEVIEEPEPEQAPEPSATRIVLEDETPGGAVQTSMRPQVRPNRPTPTRPDPVEPEEPPTQTATADENQSDVEAALAAALAAADTPAPQSPAVPAGPPMNASEKEGFRVAINRCWNYDPGSEAARVVVVVGFELDRNGKVIGNQTRLISGEGGSDANIRTAYETARRAILRCQTADGYDLPADKYDQWRDVRATFDARGVRY